MSNGTPDYQKMQRDAEQRLRDMQRRANRAVNSHDMPPVPNFVKLNQSQPSRQAQSSNPTTDFAPHSTQSSRNGNRQSAAAEPIREKSEPAQKPHKDGLFSRFSGLNILKVLNFQNIHIDNDVLIIIALIFLLSSEETDELLLLALVYIML